MLSKVRKDLERDESQHILRCFTGIRVGGVVMKIHQLVGPNIHRKT